MIYTLLWIGWLVVLGGSFAVVEAFALRNDMPGDTLSAHIRKWFSVKTKIGRTIFLIVWGGVFGLVSRACSDEPILSLTRYNRTKNPATGATVRGHGNH